GYGVFQRGFLALERRTAAYGQPAADRALLEAGSRYVAVRGGDTGSGRIYQILGEQLGAALGRGRRAAVALLSGQQVLTGRPRVVVLAVRMCNLKSVFA